MKIYAIYQNNGEIWDEAWYGIAEAHIYLDQSMANEACDKLNNRIFIPPTQEEWDKIKDGFHESWTFEDYIDSLQREFDNDHSTFEVKELNLIEN